MNLLSQPRDQHPRAVALAYGTADPAPRVIAKGRGATAESIIERARAAGIYVHESPELVSLLMQLDLDARIPQSLYEAVAELLAWICRIEHGLPVARDEGGHGNERLDLGP
jgi:flagellar biosynthesis protein